MYQYSVLIKTVSLCVLCDVIQRRKISVPRAARIVRSMGDGVRFLVSCSDL